MLRRIAREFGGTLALDCFVMRGGEIEVDDTVQLVRRPPGSTHPPD